MKSTFCILLFALISIRTIGQSTEKLKLSVRVLPVDLFDAIVLLDNILTTNEKQVFMNPARKQVIDSLNNNDVGENLRIRWNLYDTSGFAKYFYDSLGMCDPWLISYTLLNLFYEKNNFKYDVNVIVADFFNNPNKYRKYELPIYKPIEKINDTIDFACRYYQFPYSDLGINTVYKVLAIIQDYDYFFYRMKIKAIAIESDLRTPKILPRHRIGNIYWQNIICLYYDMDSYFHPNSGSP